MENPIKSVDVAIVGGGAAGISAALWCDELGLDAVLIEERSELGGQLHRIYNPIENYAGVSSPDGREMLSRFEKSLASRNFDRRIGIKVTSIDFEETKLTLGRDDGISERLSARAIILATGVRRRTLGVRGEKEMRGKGVLESGARDKQIVEGKRVVIVGGGDAAFENALILSEFARSVRVVFRKAEPTARPEFVDRARGISNVVLQPSTQLTAINGDSEVQSVAMVDLNGTDRIEIADAVLIRIGVKPNSELARNVLELDEAGYIKVDHVSRTSADRVYAVGDVANPSSPTLSTAAGTGATAVKSIFQSLVHQKGYTIGPIQR